MTSRQKYRAFLSMLKQLKHDGFFGLEHMDKLARLLLDVPDGQPDATAILERRRRAQERAEKRARRVAERERREYLRAARRNFASSRRAATVGEGKKATR